MSRRRPLRVFAERKDSAYTGVWIWQLAETVAVADGRAADHRGALENGLRVLAELSESA